MKSFKYFLAEASDKNTHLEHLEDEIVNDGLSGAKRASNFLSQLLEMLSGSSKSSVNVTVKWDGAPAIICGVNPENGKFFVGTKSVFNKKTPKINYTDSDIEQNYSGASELANKLKIALQTLSKVGIKGVLQGDLLFTKSDLKKVTIRGVQHIAFKPNTITYAVPADSELASTISSSVLGIVFHTTYNGSKISDMKASFKTNVSTLKTKNGVWITDADFRDESGTATLTSKEMKYVSTRIKKLNSMISNIDQVSLNALLSDSSVKALIKTYINSKVKVGQNVEGTKRYANGLYSHIEQFYLKEIDKLKTEKGKEGKREKLKSTIDFIKSKNSTLASMFLISALMADVKGVFINKLKAVKSIGTFLETSNGFEVTAPEGFVAVDRIGNAVKLVDRLEFSRANFTVPKTWG